MTGMNWVPAPFARSIAVRGVHDTPPLADDVTVMRGTPLDTDAFPDNGDPRRFWLEALAG
jgi:hypothetical protein